MAVLMGPGLSRYATSATLSPPIAPVTEILRICQNVRPRTGQTSYSTAPPLPVRTAQTRLIFPYNSQKHNNIENDEESGWDGRNTSTVGGRTIFRTSVWNRSGAAAHAATSSAAAFNAPAAASWGRPRGRTSDQALGTAEPPVARGTAGPTGRSISHAHGTSGSSATVDMPMTSEPAGLVVAQPIAIRLPRPPVQSPTNTTAANDQPRNDGRLDATAGTTMPCYSGQLMRKLW